MVPVIGCARWDWAFVHFLTSRWVWRSQRSEGGETIGKRSYARSDELRTHMRNVVVKTKASVTSPAATICATA